MDITERKRAESALHASEERTRFALHAASMGTWDWDLIHGVVTGSAETEVLNGLAPGTFGETEAAFEGLIHPDDWPALQAEMRATDRKLAEAKLRASEERAHLALGAARVGIWDWDALHDVTTLSVETEALHCLAPGTFQGTITRMIGTVVDITERKAAEDRDRLLTTALEACANAVVLTDQAACVEWANPAFTRLTGYPLSKILGQNIKLVKSGKQSAEFYRDLVGHDRGRRHVHGEVCNRRKDGSLYIEEMTITPVRDDAGEIAHFVAIKQDVTARSRATGG